MNALFVYIELVYIALQHPAELSVSVGRIQGKWKLSFITLALISLSLTVSRYYLRPLYDSHFGVHLLLGFLLHGLFLGCSALLLGLMVYFFSHREGMGAAAAENTIHTVVHSLLPLIFAIAAAIPARLLDSHLLYVAFFSGFSIWSCSILVRSLQYQYELTSKVMLRSVLKSLLVVLLFPLSLSALFVAELLSFFL